MRIDVLTLFPSMFGSVFNESIIGRAQEKGICTINFIDIRDFSEDKHKRVDDYPYGGGPGMIMKPEPIYNALQSVIAQNSRVIYLSPKGKVYNQSIAKELSKENHIILLCGHYEGIDNRIVENYIDDEISIGDYVLTGGEISAMVIIDSVVRLIPGVLGKEESILEESHYNGLLEYPQYTRPREFMGLKVPEILLSGNHKEIENWRKYQSLKHTYITRPDLIRKKILTEDEKKILEKIKVEISKKL